MKTMATMITERGQVSIPAEIRKQMHLAPGQRIVWEVISERECRMAVAKDPATPGAEAMRGYAARFRAPRRTQEWMRDLREGEQP
jgi:AbrB family looped-hinge helix DNA binding protein